MERKILDDIDCMCGTGWGTEDGEVECPMCRYWFPTPDEDKEIIICPRCESKLDVERGMQLLVRLTENGDS